MKFTRIILLSIDKMWQKNYDMETVMRIVKKTTHLHLRVIAFTSKKPHKSCENDYFCYFSKQIQLKYPSNFILLLIFNSSSLFMSELINFSCYSSKLFHYPHFVPCWFLFWQHWNSWFNAHPHTTSQRFNIFPLILCMSYSTSVDLNCVSHNLFIRS